MKLVYNDSNKYCGFFTQNDMLQTWDTMAIHLKNYGLAYS